MRWQPLAFLPNLNGFQFVGQRHDGTTVECYVERGADGVHRVAGGATFAELQAWRSL